MARPYALLLLLLLCGSLCAAHTPTALLKKSVRAAAKHSRQAGKASGKAIKAGVKATSSLGKTAAGTAAASIKAGKVAVEAASSNARRVSQRTWEAAKAARAAKASYTDTPSAQQQQQLEDEARQLTDAAFPPAQECDVNADKSCTANPAPAAAAAAGSTKAHASRPASAPQPPHKPLQQQAAKASKDQTAQHPAAAAAPDSGNTTQQTQEPAIPATQGTSSASKSSGWARIWTHLAAMCFGWWLRGRFSGTGNQPASQQPAETDAREAEALPAHRTLQQQERPEVQPGGAAAAAGPSSSRNGARPMPAALAAAVAAGGSSSGTAARPVPAAAVAAGAAGPSSSRNVAAAMPAAAAAAGASSSTVVARPMPAAAAGSSRQLRIDPTAPAERQQRGAPAAAAPAGDQQHFSRSGSWDPDRAAAAAVGETGGQEAANAEDDAASEAASDAGSYVVLREAESFEDGSRRSSAAGEVGLGAPVGAAGFDPPARAAAAAVEDGAGDAQVAPDGDVIDLDAAGAQEVPAAGDSANAVLVPVGGHAVIAQQLGMQHPGGYQVAGTIINVNIDGKGLGKVLAPVVHTFREVGDSLRHIADFSQRWVRKSAEQDAAQRLAAQQQLLDSAGHFGQLLCLCVMGLVALRAGRLSQVHQMCQAGMQQSAGMWGFAHRVAGTQFIPGALSYIKCCSQQLGLHFAGMFALYMLARACWSGAASFRRGGGSSGHPSNYFQLDLLVVKGVVCSWLGAHVVHCLGGAYLPWLAGWLFWCGLQLWLNVKVVSQLKSGLSVLLVAMVLPVAMALGPFTMGARLAQEHTLQAFPVLQQMPVSLRQLMPW